MTKIYVMESCPDCTKAKELYKNNPEYELIDIGQQARNLKEFINLRDNHPAFDRVKERGNIGIPCFVKEDGTVIISMKRYQESITDPSSSSVVSEIPSETPAYAEGAACNLDGTGC